MIVYSDANPKMCAVVSEYHITKVQHFVGPQTVNEAEYLGVLFALSQFPNVTEIRSDSQVVVRQLTHVYHIKEDRLRVLAERVWNISQGKVKFVWVPRKENLAGMALK